jgi:hypothetical protein
MKMRKMDTLCTSTSQLSAAQFTAQCFGFLLTPCSYGSPLVMKVRSRASSVMSGASTPGGGAFKSLSEGDLKKADEALSHVNGINGTC